MDSLITAAARPLAFKLLLEIEVSNYDIVRRPAAPGHTFEAPEGPQGL
jgi:hypothetical protein